LAQTAITSALYGEIFGLKVTSLSYQILETLPDFGFFLKKQALQAIGFQ
jgi:hypothetical protein